MAYRDPHIDASIKAASHVAANAAALTDTTFEQAESDAVVALAAEMKGKGYRPLNILLDAVNRGAGCPYFVHLEPGTEP